MKITQIHISRQARRAAAGGVAALALGGGLAACGSTTATGTAASAGAGSGSTTTTTAAAATTTPSGPAGRRGRPGGPKGGPGMAPGFGKDVTGAQADKAKAAALAKYPGTVERVVQLPDGSYEVHVVRSSGELHVKVSKDFKVTGSAQGGPGHPGGFGHGVTPPSDAGTPDGSTTNS
jgi:hypothetical protein